jgi:phospholipid-binding lipoprotein MlaA
MAMTTTMRAAGARPRVTPRAAAVGLALLLTGCATPPPEKDAEATAEFRALNDPIEPFNRGVFAFNQGVDALLLKPTAEFYLLIPPPPVRDGVSNFVANLQTPVILINDLLQAEWQRAGVTFSRFIVNTIVGFGGLADPATSLGLDRHSEDFGQTLAVWGVGEGPFLMLPVIGPSNPRDATGLAVDSAVFNPLGLARTVFLNGNYAGLSYAQTGLRAVDARAGLYDEINDIEKSSLDPYATFRSLYRQFRVAEIHQGNPPAAEDGPTLDIVP